MLGVRRRLPVVAAVSLAAGLVMAGGRWAPAVNSVRPSPDATTAAAPALDVRTSAGGPTPPAPLPTPSLPPLDLLPAEPVPVGSEIDNGPPTVEDADGIVVHERLAPLVRTLLAEAEIAGIELEGTGYRDIAAQRRLRAANCPNPATSPAEDCSPPTALPGTSFHESGLAIDFTSGGELITSREHPAYRWLAANAGWIGLRVHPDEPWHWSYRR